MPAIKACLFDLDGVIVDTARFHYIAWRQLANDLGFDLSEEENEKLKGISRMESLEIILEIGGVKLSDDEKLERAAVKNTRYLELCMQMTPDDTLPGVRRFLDELESASIKTGLGSASKNARPILEKVGILDYFDAIVDGNDVTNAKPDPEVFLMASQLVGKPAKGSIVFEDSVAGIQAANVAGMISIGIGDKTILHEAQYNFNDFTEIDIHFLETLVNK